MSDYLNNLLARSRNLAPVVQPRLASLFEPTTTAASRSSRHLFEAETMRETTSESESSPQISPVISPQVGQPTRQHLQAAVVVPPARTEQKKTNGGERDESREASSQHSLNPLSTVTSAPPSLPAQSARPAPDVQAGAFKTLPPLRDSPQLAAPRGAEERAGTPLTIATNHQENWAGLEPKVRQLVSEQLAPLRLSQTHAFDGVQGGAPQHTQAAASSGIAQTQDNRPKKPTQTFGQALERAEPLHTISVTIGRVDVRAIISQQPAPSPRPAQQTSALSLDEYLKQRSGGHR